MSSAIVPTYARADLAFERGDGCWLTSTTGERYLDFGAGIAVVSLGHSHPHLVEALTEPGRASSGTLRTCSRFPRANASRVGLPTRPSPTSSSSPIPAPRRTRRDQDGAQVAIGRRPSRALRHPHLRGRLPWPHPGDHRRRRPGQISRGFRPEGRGLRPDSVRRPRGRRGGDRPADRRDHDRADPGRGRRAGRSAALPARPARALRRAWAVADLRRSAERHGPHRQVLCL